MPKTCAPRYRVRLADGEGDRIATQKLRFRCFRAGQASQPDPTGQELRDHDAFDAHCRHVLIERTEDGALMACFRLLPLASGAEIARSYSAQYYDLSALSTYSEPLLELGRFCIAPDGVEEAEGADILRLAWGEITRVVDAERIGLLFGCSSFQGTDVVRYLDVFGVLRQAHLAPARHAPRRKAPEVVPFDKDDPGGRPPDRNQALRLMPPLLRSYLSMGGWVSDHAVVDRDLNTLHVFTGVEIAAIPPGRARLLRALTQDG
ncbi:GNAT family N-acetyltransferase [Aliiroseovarius crassostreae]|uniref:L-ornithine N(alpha)-acyltransferase n=1 Tax=Aliiroseovarius crassostreae TaxID=154981 RepID=A0A9Q9M070_9RHOB|nr:GNAT family N-acetyltransferase [Aliiroseovarius crassostreae]UWP93151.1 GNAT family N-acetyltransferase [Aliiroseovarius crassostreae]UWP96289.1 GNAT family N-acetyltransferase [Aliiroseovarius crassostreae]